MMQPREVHQFHSGTSVGDAITNEMLAWQVELRALGFASEIYAQHVPEALRDAVRRVERFEPSPDSVLLLHHSMGHDQFDLVVQRAARIVTVFHNITPTALISDAGERRYAELGRRQLRELAERSVGAIADSNYNRREMLRAGFDRATVIPVKTTFGSAERVVDGPVARSNDWLFVGRVVPSKGQFDVLTAFALYSATHDPEARLRFVGDLAHNDYVDMIFDEAARLQVSDRVDLLGKIDDADLDELYASSGVYVSLSEHEGFGVPLLEAMAAGLPVVAYASSAVPETLGGAGMLLRSKAPQHVVEVVRRLLTDGSEAGAMVRRQTERLRAFVDFDVRAALSRVVAESTSDAASLLTLQIQGPFETSYSLATLNRELATGLANDAMLDVSIYATEGPGDYSPLPEDLARFPEAAALHAKAPMQPFPDVVVRQMYPPRVDDSPGGLTFQYFGWEESRLPTMYVDQFNEHLDGIGVMSQFVADVLADSGVNVPIEVVGVGVRHPALEAAVVEHELLHDLRAFRFLHISSAFPRKGVDILLEAYFAKFTDNDDVTLILKTFPNPHNDVAALLAEMRAMHPNAPDVRWIDEDMVDAEIDALYGLASCLVHPCRGEGFGLPVAEAMLARVPVIAPAATGLADFVSDRSAWTVPFVSVEARTHLSVPGSTWAEPDVSAVGEAMRSMANGTDRDGVDERVEAAFELISTEYSWAAVCRRWSSFIQAQRERTRAPRVAMVTTWNSRCGIAEYSAALIDRASDRWDVEIFANRDARVISPRREAGVQRVWREDPRADISALREQLAASSADLVHIQHNFGFIGLRQLATLISEESKRRPVVLTLHRTEDLDSPDLRVHLGDIAAALRDADRIIVHQAEDVERLHAMGVDNVVTIPIGSAHPIETDAQTVRSSLELSIERPVVGTFGFLLPHKGIVDLIRTAAIMRDRGRPVAVIGLCALHPDPSSAVYHQVCLDEITQLDLSASVRLVTDFLPPDVSRMLLSTSDVVALPYHVTAESSSASLRSVLPIGRPVLATDLAIFEDASEALVLVPSSSTPAELADALEALLDDPALRERKARAALDLARRSSIDRSVATHTTIYLDMVAAR